MKLLIVGGTGLLSGAVLKEALRHNIEVTIVNRGKKSKLVPDGAKVIIADYRDKDVMIAALDGTNFDAVIDFICYNKEQIQYSIELFAPYCAQYVFISSACVYDYSKIGIKTEDDDKVFKEWDYSVNKWDCESHLTKMAKERGVNYTIIRPCITFDDSRIPYGMMPPYGYHWTFVERILNEKPIVRWNGGTTRWSMMRVEDFAVGLVGIIGNKNAYNQAFNICGDDAYSWNDVIGCVEDILQKKAILYDITSEEYSIILPDKKGRILGRSSDLVCSNKKIKEFVPEFHITYSLRQGLEKTIKAYREGNYQKGIDYAYDASEDRIVRESCKIHDINTRDYNLRFIDYIGNATLKEKLRYYVYSQKMIMLGNGRMIPVIGFGTFPYKKIIVNNLRKAIQGGVKLVDTSDNYGNEEYVGEGLSELDLSEVTIISKFSQPHRTCELDHCFEESKKKLGKLNIYLLHWPYPYLWKLQWRKMEELYNAGKCDAIGVCNFDKGHMRELLSFCRIKPALNQIERHPLFQQQELVDYCIANEVAVMAYSPVARMDSELQNSPTLNTIAKKYKKTVNQVILRWDIETNCIPIPASSSELHIKENFDIFDFCLDVEEIALIKNLEKGKRIRYNPRTRFSFRERFRFLTYRVKNYFNKKRD